MQTHTGSSSTLP